MSIPAWLVPTACRGRLCVVSCGAFTQPACVCTGAAAARVLPAAGHSMRVTVLACAATGLPLIGRLSTCINMIGHRPASGDMTAVKASACCLEGWLQACKKQYCSTAEQGHPSKSRPQ